MLGCLGIFMMLIVSYALVLLLSDGIHYLGLSSHPTFTAVLIVGLYVVLLVAQRILRKDNNS